VGVSLFSASLYELGKIGKGALTSSKEDKSPLEQENELLIA
jgi:hypothetical protein